MAVLSYYAGHPGQGENYLQEAYDRAKTFDGTKQTDKLRYVHFSDQHKPAFADDFGSTAMDGLKGLIEETADTCSKLKETWYGIYSKDN